MAQLYPALCLLLALPTHGYVNPRPSLVRRSAFVGPAASPRQPLAIARNRRPITTSDGQQHVLFASTTDSVDASMSGGTASSSAPLGESGDWTAYLDESKGLIYYFNPRTGESKCK